MPAITYRISFTPTPGSLGTRVEYREQGSSTWILPSAPANPTTLPYYDLSLTAGTSYNLRLSAVGTSCSIRYKYLNLIIPSGGMCCPSGYTLSPDSSYCFQEQTVSPTTVQSSICFATSQDPGQYSSGGAKIYSAYDLHLTASSTYTSILGTQWQEVTSGVTGPMNREGIWVDTNCDGTLDPLTAGETLQITVPITLSVAKTLYVGIGGDNTFKIDLDGTTIVDCSNTNPAGGHPSDNFNFWHLIPIAFPSGTSYLNLSGVGDGSTVDAFAAVVYDNNSSQLTSATSDSSLTRLFHTSSLRGTHLDIATCPTGYFLDTSGGAGHYQCKKVVTASPVSC